MIRTNNFHQKINPLLKEHLDIVLSAGATPIGSRVWIIFAQIAQWLAAKNTLQTINNFLSEKNFRIGTLGEYILFFGEKYGLPALENRKIIVQDAHGKYGIGMFVQETDKISFCELPKEFKTNDNILVFLIVSY
jgi:hypothetical protein